MGAPITKHPKLPLKTDAERHARFVETAREVGASEDPKDFEKAFSDIVEPKRSGVEKPLAANDHIRHHLDHFAHGGSNRAHERDGLIHSLKALIGMH